MNKWYKQFHDAPVCYGDVPYWERDHRREKLCFWWEFAKSLAWFLLGTALLMGMMWAVMLAKS